MDDHIQSGGTSVSCNFKSGWTEISIQEPSLPQYIKLEMAAAVHEVQYCREMQLI